MARHNLCLFRPDFSRTYHSGIIQKLRHIIGNFTVHYQDGMLECICKPGNKKEPTASPSKASVGSHNVSQSNMKLCLSDYNIGMSFFLEQRSTYLCVQ